LTEVNVPAAGMTRRVTIDAGELPLQPRGSTVSGQSAP
jgi:hypothetical protein